MKNRKMKLSEMRTYVYIDVSNIRYACLWSCGFKLDFIKFYNYLRGKYSKLEEVRYYEGVSMDDERKLRHFRFLEERIGYKVCSLERKSYVDPAQYAEFECGNCGEINTVKVLSEKVKLKSNVDVYLTADMLEKVSLDREPLHIILVSCDGDYAEAIKSILRVNPEARVTVMATPMTRRDNYLSLRLKRLSRELGEGRYMLSYITNIQERVARDE